MLQNFILLNIIFFFCSICFFIIYYVEKIINFLPVIQNGDIFYMFLGGKWPSRWKWSSWTHGNYVSYHTIFNCTINFHPMQNLPHCFPSHFYTCLVESKITLSILSSRVQEELLVREDGQDFLEPQWVPLLILHNCNPSHG